MTVLAAALGAGCSARTLQIVDPYPCADGSASACPPPGLLDDLVGYWRLDDPRGSTIARDASGWGNDGTLVDLAPATAWVMGGPSGGALSVQGMGSVVVPASESIDSITRQVTVAAWVFLEGPIDEYGTAISRQVGTSYEQHYHLAINADDRPTMYITADTKVFLAGPTAIPRQTWVHIAGTYDGGRARLYRDGAEVSSAAQSGRFADESAPVIISGNVDEVSDRAESFPGRLDEIMLYRRALTPEEIRRLRNGALFHQ